MKKRTTPKPWKKKKGILKERYSVLSDDDLTYERGKEGELLTRIQEKLGKSRQEIKNIIKSL